MNAPSSDLSHAADQGRYVVVFDTSDPQQLQEQAPRLLRSNGYSTTEYFPRLGIALVTSDTAHLDSFSSICRQEQCPMHYAPELTYHAINVSHTPDQPALETSFADTDELTWGLQAVRAPDSPATGAGIRLAVLDTGFASFHPDFAGRTVVSESFIEDEDGEDTHGHGTHCIGTAAGPRQREEGRGYGVAPEADIYSGKVLGADGSGSDASILAGIDWALQNECAVVNMSLGADVAEIHPPYVAAGRRALEQGTLLIAAAGNNANRSEGNPGFVGAPANSPYIMAVGAVDSQLRVADFSARSLPERGGQVDLAAPGVDVYSSWPEPEGHRVISGTSMAAPHVSGIAALIAEADGLRGRELWAELVRRTASLEDPAVDIGAGLSLAVSINGDDEDDPEES